MPTEREQKLLEAEENLAKWDNTSMASWLKICECLEIVRALHLCGERREDYKTWITGLQLKSSWANSYSWACRAANIHKFFVLGLEKPQEELYQLGKAKLCALISLARKNELDDRTWRLALEPMTTLVVLYDHLRELKGQENPDRPRREIECPHCGNRNTVVKCVKCAHEFTVYK